MNYGLYLSAAGVLTNSYRQDVIANNLANAETVGFKRDVPLFRQRMTASQESRQGPRNGSDPTLENIGGGLFASPVSVDTTAGDMEQTFDPKTVAIQGEGFLGVRDGNDVRLTRDGRLAVDREGNLVSAISGHAGLDVTGQPIHLDSSQPIAIGGDGTVTQSGKSVGRLGLFKVDDPRQLRKRGGTLLSYPGLDAKRLTAATGTFRSEFVERSNVEPATELTALMDAQRQLEANANMIRIQDQMLSRLVNDVGKVG